MTASGSRIFIANDYTKNEGNTVNHNVYHKEAGKDGIWNWKNREYDSFTAYQKGTANDSDSIYADPMYRDESSYDFTLKPGSPAVPVIQ